MGDPGSYKQELPDMPDSLNSFRNYVHSVLQGTMQQNEASYPGPGGSNMALDRPDYLPTLRSYAANWVSRNPGAAIWDVVEDAIEDILPTGDPAHGSSYWTAAKAAVELQLEQTQADINEAAIVDGTRYGTGVIRAHTKEIALRNAEMGMRYAELELDSLNKAKERRIAAITAGVELGKARNDERLRWLIGALQVGVNDWTVKIQAEQLRYQDFMNRQWTHRPSFPAAVQYALSYPFQGSNPVITPNPYQSAGMGMLQAGASIAGAAIIAASAREFKSDIRPISEKAVHDAMLSTRVHSWRYTGDEVTHMGPIADDAPRFMSTDYGIYLGDYIASLHATIQHMNKRVKELENAIR